MIKDMSKTFEWKTITSNDARIYLARTGNNDTFKIHRWDGPAIVPLKKGCPMEKSYYLWGTKYTKEEFDEQVRDREGVPFYKTTLGKQTGERV